MFETTSHHQLSSISIHHKPLRTFQTENRHLASSAVLPAAQPAEPGTGTSSLSFFPAASASSSAWSGTLLVSRAVVAPLGDKAADWNGSWDLVGYEQVA